MKVWPRRFLFGVVATFTLARAPLVGQAVRPASSTNEVPRTSLNDDAAPPFMGVWEPMYEGVGATDNFARWLNRRTLFPVITQYAFSPEGWPGTFDRYWVDPAWGKWVAQAPGRRAIIFVSLPTDRSSLQEGAKGKDNAKAMAMANYLIANNLCTSIICMGLLNPPNSWESATSVEAAQFVLYWRQLVTAVRSVPGAEKLQFDWVGMNRKTSFPLEEAYPGDAYVDFVGMMLFDQCLDKDIYPYPINATADQKRARQKKAWDLYYYPAARNGLAAWQGIAKAHGKPFSLPLWCLYSDHYEDGTLSTGGDDSYFVQQMHTFIQDPNNDVYFSCYMDNYYGCTKLSPSKDYTTIYPESAALFQKLFSVPLAPASTMSP